MRDVIKPSQQCWQSRRAGYYGRFVTHTALITKDAGTFKRGAKHKDSFLERCGGKKWYGRMSHPSPFSPQAAECMCGVQQVNSTGLNAWPRQWGDPVALLCHGGILLAWFGSNCSLRGKHHEGSLNGSMGTDPTPNQRISFQGIVFVSPVEFRHSRESTPSRIDSSIQAARVGSQHLIKTFYVGYSFSLSAVA